MKLDCRKRLFVDSSWAAKLSARLTELSWPDATCASSRHFFSRKKKQVQRKFLFSFFSFFLHFSSSFWRRVPRLASSYWPILVKQILNQRVNLKKGVVIIRNFGTATLVSATLAYVYGFCMLLNFVLSAKSTKYTKLNPVRKYVRLQY